MLAAPGRGSGSLSGGLAGRAAPPGSGGGVVAGEIGCEEFLGTGRAEFDLRRAIKLNSE